MSYEGAWKRNENFEVPAVSEPLNVTVKGSSSGAAAAKPQVRWLTALGPDQGQADVYLDGKLVNRVSLTNPTRVTNKQAFAATGLKDKQHTLRIVKASGEVLRSDVVRYTIAR